MLAYSIASYPSLLYAFCCTQAQLMSSYIYLHSYASSLSVSNANLIKLAYSGWLGGLVVGWLGGWVGGWVGLELGLSFAKLRGGRSLEEVKEDDLN